MRSRLSTRLLLLGALSLTLAASASGQSSTPASTPAASPAQAPVAAPAANPADVASLDAIVEALYASISGPKGAPRDWPRLRSLFGPNGRLIPTSVNAAGRAGLRNWSVEEYITAAEPGLMANGFYEREIGRTVESYGNVTHIMSAYDSKRTLEDAAPFQRGVNSIQLFNAGTRWYILTVMWDSERPGNEIPARFLNKKP